MNVCPKGHEGWGILEGRERVNCADGTPAFVNSYRCEVCGEHWIDDQCEDSDEEEDEFEPPEGHVICINCNGRGRVDGDKWCHYCNGEGFVPSEYSWGDTRE